MADPADNEGVVDCVADLGNKQTCGTSCKCEELNRIKLRAACTDEQTHMMMCYVGMIIVTDLLQN